MAPGGTTVELTVRDAVPDDAAAVAELLGALGYPVAVDEARGRLARGGDRGLLAEADGRPVGLLALGIGSALQHARPLARVNVLVVMPAARGLGIGRRLMARAEELAREAGCDAVELTTGLGPDRQVAHRFYEALGYERTSYRLWRSLSAAGQA